MTADRPWHRVWPAHVPRSIDYPRVPAWWLLERNLPRFASRVALQELADDTSGEARSLTYEQLWRAVRGVAEGLREHDLGGGLRVGLCLPQSVASIVGAFATWYAGGETVPIDPSAGDDELTEWLGEAEVTLVTGLAGSGAERAAESLQVPFIDTAALREMERGRPGGPGDYRSDEDVAAILPTGALLSHRGLVTHTMQATGWFGVVPGEEVVCCAPPTSPGAAISVMNVAMSAGATLLVAPGLGAETAARAVTRHRVTRLFGGPDLFGALVAEAPGRVAGDSSLRPCWPLDASWPLAVKQGFDALVGRETLIDAYGISEAGALTHANPPGRTKAGSIGIPLPDTDARIADPETGIELAPGQPGELMVRGPQVLRGYWNRDSQTARAVRDGWLATRHAAVMDADGYFTIAS